MREPTATVTARPQSAPAVLMVRPACFGWNPETHASNRFQGDDPGADAAATAAQAVVEFDGLVAGLRAAGVVVHVLDDRVSPCCPDAVFPNNWISLHADGTVVLYPMLAPNRRLERRPDAVAALAGQAGLGITRWIDLTAHEAAGRCLEGTGSVVFDHVARVAYACLSPRTDAAVLRQLCDEIGYEPCTFAAADAQGVPIYHTNVMLALGTRWCVVAAGAIDAADRPRVLERLRATQRHIEEIDGQAMGRYAGNVLEVAGRDGAVLALSASAAAAFGPEALARLDRCVARRVVAAVPTIEALGGGSVRCMLAEVFLPRR